MMHFIAFHTKSEKNISKKLLFFTGVSFFFKDGSAKRGTENFHSN